MQEIPTVEQPTQPSINLPSEYQPPHSVAHPGNQRNGLLRKLVQWLNGTSNTSEPLVRSYLFMRRGIGIIGVALPIVLVFGTMILDWHFELKDSISAYYYSLMGDVFTGSLCAVGVFLICYRYERLDDIVSTFAGICAIGVALFPITPDHATAQQVIIGDLHGVFAASLFLVLALMAIFLFRRTDQVDPGVRKQQRDIVYLICGIVMIACVALSVPILFIPSLNVWLHPLHPILVLEGLAIWAFGWAWFVKGGTLGILKDTKGGAVVPEGMRSGIAGTAGGAK
ncbi:MAG TPA: hypothetical protein VEI53_07120 [Ktedonobacteraceae bacterium]|nr:hypothetical protein [Ktedonobacteraceae bacterium]